MPSMNTRREPLSSINNDSRHIDMIEERPMAFPYPGEKIYVQDEEDIIVATKKAEEMAKRIFAPLLK